MENNVKLYHLVNDYNDHNEYTTDEEKIRKIYIDECLQCVDNNICEDITQEESARNWLYESMYALYHYDTDYLIEKLNKEHNWLIEVYDGNTITSEYDNLKIFYLAIQISKTFSLENKWLLIDTYYDKIKLIAKDYIKYDNKNKSLLDSINDYISNNKDKINTIIRDCIED